MTARLARVLRRFDRRALHVVTRLIPDERRRIFGLTLVIGVVCGGAAVAFHLTILLAERLLIDRAISAPTPLWLPLTIGLPAVGGLISGILLTFVVPDARGSGIPQVKVAYVINGGVNPSTIRSYMVRAPGHAGHETSPMVIKRNLLVESEARLAPIACTICAADARWIVADQR